MEVSESYLIGFLVISTLVLLSAGLSVVYLVYNSVKKKLLFQQELTNTSIEVAEAVQQRIGMDLHDGIGPDIMVAKYQLASLFIDTDKIHFDEIEVKAIQEHLDYCLKQVRSISHSLVPQVLLTYGLKAGIKNFTSKIASSAQIEFDLDLNGDDSMLDDDVSLAIYRVVQESINNAIKHGNATTIRIVFKIKDSNHFMLSVNDNGGGFDCKKSLKGVGLKSINLRASNLRANLSIDSSINGTTLKLTKDEGY